MARDYLNAAGKTVTLDGGTGNDSLQAQGRVYKANQWQYVQNGKATLSGGEGNDSLNVESYVSAELFGGKGNDNLWADWLLRWGCNHVNARLFGEEGNDNLSANIRIGWNQEQQGVSQKDHRSAVLDGGDGDDTLNTNIYGWSTQLERRLYSQ